MIATEYERLGECNRCNGQVICCNRVINMKMIGGDRESHGGYTVDGKGVWAEVVRDSDNDDDREFVRFEFSDKETRCEALTSDNLCEFHNNGKAWSCRVFPTLPRDIAHIPECSYEFRELNNWKFEDGDDSD
jgi:hypothetical protein